MTDSPAVVAKPATVKPASTASLQPIPFRKDPVTSTPEIFGLLVTTLLVVGVFAVLAWYARRRGWLDRWVGPAPQMATKNKRISVLESQRVSQKTIVYRVSDGDSEFLLVESSMQIQLMPQKMQKEPSGD